MRVHSLPTPYTHWIVKEPPVEPSAPRRACGHEFPKRYRYTVMMAVSGMTFGFQTCVHRRRNFVRRASRGCGVTRAQSTEHTRLQTHRQNSDLRICTEKLRSRSVNPFDTCAYTRPLRCRKTAARSFGRFDDHWPPPLAIEHLTFAHFEEAFHAHALLQPGRVFYGFTYRT
jgi:hypothetical protein